MKQIPVLTKKDISRILLPRKKDSHKGDHGHTLLVAGHIGRMGAAVIAARACLRSGTGLLTVMVPAEERMILQNAIPEAMLVMRENVNDLSRYSAIGIGPALGTDDEARGCLLNIISNTTVPLLLDADALTILAAGNDLYGLIQPGTILTPHPKEFDRVFGSHDNNALRQKAAITFAKEKNIVIVLKGHETLVTDGTHSIINTTGNAGLAKGGSGDTLTGIITALLAQGYRPFEAASTGVYLHGLAADLALKEQSMESMLASDVIEYLGKAFKKIRK